MRDVVLEHEIDLAGWREQSRALILAHVPPGMIAWRTVNGERDLFAQPDAAASPGALQSKAPSSPGFRVPRQLRDLAGVVIRHRDPHRFALLYELLWRTTHGEPHLIYIAADPLVRRLEAMAASVRRETHKMQAFVRFRETADDAGMLYLAWFEPDHFVVEATAPFFVRRFASMRWAILTPHRSVHWDGSELGFAAGARRADAGGEDALEELWRSYYASIFNPARLKVRAMQAQMPRRYWRNLPEARVISSLSQQASARCRQMLSQGGSSEPAGSTAESSARAGGRILGQARPLRRSASND